MLYSDLREVKSVLEIDPQNNVEDKRLLWWIEQLSSKWFEVESNSMPRYTTLVSSNQRRLAVITKEEFGIGSKIHRLTVIGYFLDDKGHQRWDCRCICGTIVDHSRNNLLGGTIYSCGCYKRECQIAFNKRTKSTYGGISKDPILSIIHTRWFSMKQRVKKWHTASHICKFLLSDPRNLLKLLGLPTGDKKSLDRFPVSNGNYTCGQCEECIQNGWVLNIRWASRLEQGQNKRSTIYVEAFGQRRCLSDWSRQSGIYSYTIKNRIVAGMSPEEALTTPDKWGNCYKPNGDSDVLHGSS